MRFSHILVSPYNHDIQVIHNDRHFSFTPSMNFLLSIKGLFVFKFFILFSNRIFNHANFRRWSSNNLHFGVSLMSGHITYVLYICIIVWEGLQEFLFLFSVCVPLPVGLPAHAPIYDSRPCSSHRRSRRKFSTGRASKERSERLLAVWTN